MSAIQNRPSTDGTTPPDRRSTTARPVRRRTSARSSWSTEQAELVRELGVLIRNGLIVAVDDGLETRYAAAGDEGVLP